MSSGRTGLGFQALLGVGFLRWHIYVGKGAAVLQSGMHAVACGGVGVSTFQLLTVVVFLVVAATSRTVVVNLTGSVMPLVTTPVAGRVVVQDGSGFGVASFVKSWVVITGVMDQGYVRVLRSSEVPCS